MFSTFNPGQKIKLPFKNARETLLVVELKTTMDVLYHLCFSIISGDGGMGSMANMFVHWNVPQDLLKIVLYF